MYIKLPKCKNDLEVLIPHPDITIILGTSAAEVCRVRDGVGARQESERDL